MSVTIKTNMGDLKIELYCELTPITCKNFLALAAKGYYNETIFHRNIKNFIIQGGDPSGTGKGGESIYGKHFKDEYIKELRHDKRGVVSMANSGPNTNGSQFFIAYSKQQHLNDKYTIFGQVIDGFSTLDKFEAVPVDKFNKPLNEIKILSITIHYNLIAEYEGAYF